jgi:hypothetical protein
MVEPAQPGRQVEFLHLLQAGDDKAPAAPAALISGPGVVGAAAGDTAVVFALPAGQPAREIAYPAPAGVTRHVVTGLLPDTGFEAAVAAGRVTVRAVEGGGRKSDPGGVLVF